MKEKKSWENVHEINNVITFSRYLSLKHDIRGTSDKVRFASADIN